jgi:ParB-like chromosome segregation protein Spo0J
MSTRIPLAQLALYTGTQVRAALNPEVVASYAEAMHRGDEFPPVMLVDDGVTRYLVDGFHRLKAAEFAGATDLPANIITGTREDALWYALGANRANGERLTEADKTHAVTLALRAWPERMQREIAEQIGCSESLVSKVKLELSEQAGEPVLLVGRALQLAQRQAAVREMITAGASTLAIRQQTRAHPTFIAEQRRQLRQEHGEAARPTHEQRRAQVREMLLAGMQSSAICKALRIHNSVVADERQKILAVDPAAPLHRPKGAATERLSSGRPVNNTTHPQHQEIAIRIKEGKFVRQIAKELGVSRDAVTKVRQALGLSMPHRTPAAVKARTEQMRKMAGNGSSSRQIASAVGLSEQRVRDLMRREGIPVPADAIVGRSKRHDANRIVDQMVMDAENLTADVELIDFTQLDRRQLVGWIKSLSTSREQLMVFIRRLMKEQQQHHGTEVNSSAV